MKLLINDLILLAKESEVSNRHSAALVSNNTVYNYGVNSYTTKKINNRKIICCKHAEISVFHGIKQKDLKKISRMLDLVVIRISKNGSLCNSMPCKNCIETLRKIGIKRIFYSDDNGNILVEDAKNITNNHVSAFNRFVSRELPRETS